MMDSLNKGAIGVSGAIFGFAISKATFVFWLQMVSLLGGIIVTVLTAISISFSIRRKWRAYKAEQSNKHSTTKDDEEPTTTT